jgi:peptidoglycan/xylan/chitin deacetylase (PgdA/CDA1 family)
VPREHRQRLPGDKADARPVDAELANSKAALAAQGFNATAFAPPYGDYDMSTVAQVAKYYTSMRGFADVGNNASGRSATSCCTTPQRRR